MGKGVTKNSFKVIESYSVVLLPLKSVLVISVFPETCPFRQGGRKYGLRLLIQWPHYAFIFCRMCSNFPSFTPNISNVCLISSFLALLNPYQSVFSENQLLHLRGSYFTYSHVCFSHLLLPTHFGFDLCSVLFYRKLRSCSCNRPVIHCCFFTRDGRLSMKKSKNKDKVTSAHTAPDPATPCDSASGPRSPPAIALLWLEELAPALLTAQARLPLSIPASLVGKAPLPALILGHTSSGSASRA